jgi:hypothetical protein
VSPRKNATELAAYVYGNIFFDILQQEIFRNREKANGGPGKEAAAERLVF